MEIPYSLLLRMGFALWWRYCVLWLAIVVVLAIPLLVAMAFVPQFADALASFGFDRDYILLGVLPACEALMAFPLAVGWFLRQRAESFGLTAVYRGANPAIVSHPQRQQILFGWSVFFMPFAWEVLNALLIHGLFADVPESVRVWASIAAIYANSALLQALVFLPMNLNWVLHNRFAGVEWTRKGTANPEPAQSR